MTTGSRKACRSLQFGVHVPLCIRVVYVGHQLLSAALWGKSAISEHTSHAGASGGGRSGGMWRGTSDFPPLRLPHLFKSIDRPSPRLPLSSFLLTPLHRDLQDGSWLDAHTLFPTIPPSSLQFPGRPP